MADVSSTLAAWSSTTASNAPAGSTTIGTNLDDNLREIQGVIVRGLSHKGSDIASAATTDLGAVEGLMHDITGTTTITSFGTVRAGILKFVKFEGALTLTHNATSLILPGAANITCSDGDVGIFISEGSGNWRCLAYMKAAGSPTQPATQAEQETGTSVITTVTPGRQNFHPSAAKAWVKFNSAGAVAASYNITDITDNGAGSWTINIATDFSTANYCGVGFGGTLATGLISYALATSAAAGSFQLISKNTANTPTDPDSPNEIYAAFFGDQA